MGTTTSIIQGHTSQFNFHIATGTEAAAALSAAERLDEYLAQVQRSRANAIARQSMTYAANRLTMSQVERLKDRIQGFIPA